MKNILLIAFMVAMALVVYCFVRTERKGQVLQTDQQNQSAFVDMRPARTQQNYEFTCGENTFALKFATFAKPEQPPTSQLLSLTINGSKPSNEKYLQELYDVFPKLTGLDLPAMTLCEGSAARLGIETYWSGSIRPIFLVLYFFENGEIRYAMLDEEDNKVPEIKLIEK